MGRPRLPSDRLFAFRKHAPAAFSRYPVRQRYLAAFRCENDVLLFERIIGFAAILGRYTASDRLSFRSAIHVELPICVFKPHVVALRADQPDDEEATPDAWRCKSPKSPGRVDF